ncbi:MAG: hypothetical protein AABX11_02215 [Nanoarchaeota archaeon]
MIEDYFRGTKVFVEVQGGSFETVLYDGVYDSIRPLGKREFLVLRNASFYTCSDVPFKIGEGEEEESLLIRAGVCLVDLEKIISICPDEKNHREDVPFVTAPDVLP